MIAVVRTNHLNLIDVYNLVLRGLRRRLCHYTLRNQQRCSAGGKSHLAAQQHVDLIDNFDGAVIKQARRAPEGHRRKMVQLTPSKLEDQFCCQLKLPRRESRRDAAEGSIAHVPVRRLVVHLVQNVEGLRAELELRRFVPEAEILMQPHISLEKRRTNDHVPLRISKRTGTRVSNGRRNHSRLPRT